MDIDNQSLDHDELLGVEALEDIIDVENEMGFGEGEDWSHDDSDVGYGKLAANRKRALNKASAPHSRPRNSPLGIRPHRPRKPLSVIRHGIKHGASSSSDGDEKLTRVRVSARPGTKHGSFSSSNGVDKLKMKDEAVDNTNDPLGIFETDDVDTDHSLRSSQDVEGIQDLRVDSNMKGDNNVYSLQESKQSGIQREKDSKILIKPDENGSRKEHAQKDAKKGISKLEEKTANSNRVRFSLDFETTEKVMGNASKRGSDGKEKAKCGKQQEWRYVRSTPSDSTGFGAPKASTGAPARATSTQRRKEPAIAESSKDSSLGFDLERAIEMRDDKKAARLAQERIEQFEDAMVKQQEIVANMRLSLASEGTKDHTKLRPLVDALDRNIKKVTASSKVRQVPQSYELKNRAEQINKLKTQCNLLETDRERLKKKLRHLLENADGNEREQEARTKERESDASTNERENLLEQKVRGLENSLVEWESKFKKVEADFAMERGLLEDSLSVCKLDWRNKQQRWVVKMKEREAELSQMKMSQDKLVDSLVSCRQCMDKLTKEAAACTVNFTLHGESTPSEGDNAFAKENNALTLAYSIQNDMESLRRLLAESSSALQHEPKLQPEVLRQESKVLENKVAQTISMMTELKQEMKAKEDQIKKENEKYAQVVADKVKHVEALEDQLTDKEHDMEGFMQELKDEVRLLNKELEQERSERARLSDMQGNMKYKLLKGLRKKEQKLEEEMEGMNEKMEEMRASIAQKDERIASLEDEVKAKSDQLVHEKQKWNMAIKEVKQKAAKTILRFMNGKENGLLEHLRERRKGHKASECHTGLTCKTDDDEEYQEGLSTKEKLQAKRHYARAMSRELDSPRESQHVLPKCRENVAVHEDLRSSFELQKDKAKHDYDSFARKEDYCLQEFHPKEKSARRNRITEKRDVLKLLDRRRKGNGDNTLTILQDTVHDF